MFASLDLNPSNKKLADFAGGMTIVSLIAIPVLIYFFRDSQAIRWPSVMLIGLLVAAVFTTSRFLFPMALKPLYVVWVGLSALIGMVIGPIILSIVYYGVITPVGLLSRSTGKVWLDTATKDSYWLKLESHSQKTFHRPF